MHRMLSFRIVPLLVFIAWTSALSAANGRDQMNRFLQDLNTLQANFEQTVFNENTRELVASEGVFYVRRPDQFRWDYISPENQQIIADGRQIWVYDPELEQVSVQSQATALTGTPAMLLISGDPVEKHFSVMDLGERDGQGWVELAPKDEESQFSRILLAFSENQLISMEMVDKFGQITRFHFSAIENNPVFTSRFFEFEPPLNIDIYNQ